MFLSDVTASLTNLIFAENYIEVYPETEVYGAGAALLANEDTNASIVNCTFINNQPTGIIPAGGAISIESGELKIINTILWGNQATDGPQLYVNPDSIATVLVYSSNIDQVGFGSNGNIRQNPMLDSDYHLITGSPCIDKGELSNAPDIDIDGDTRPQGLLPDIGADEFLPGS